MINVKDLFRNFVFLVTLTAATPMFGAELWSWHAFDFTLVKNARWDWTLHTRVRSREGALQQGRSGAIGKFQLRPRLSLIAGYYYGREDIQEEWSDFHRPFAGVEIPLVVRGAATLAVRSLAERFLVGERPDFSRFRQRLRLVTDRRLGLLASTEWFFDRQGYLSARYSAGVRWRIFRGGALEVGYLYDARAARAGGPRHGIVTHLLLERPQKP
mgnify:CR=1 FL=1